jgi:cytochrome c-type biogenesis protein CcmH/NrfG
MKLSIYIKKRLFSDIILLLVVSGTGYLLVDTWNKVTQEEEPAVELMSFDENLDDGLG